jgi:hypothetical protein
VYEAVAKKSRKWDEEARAKHWLLREDAGDGGATPNQLNQISAYRWREQRDHEDPPRKRAVEEARRRRAQEWRAKSYADAHSGTYGVIPTTVGMVIARLDGDGDNVKVDPLVHRMEEKEDGHEGDEFPVCVRSDCPCTSTRDDRVGEYCGYACA